MSPRGPGRLKPLTKDQQMFLRSVQEHGYWYPRCGWVWETEGRSKQLAESLAKRGDLWWGTALVTCSHDGSEREVAAYILMSTRDAAVRRRRAGLRPPDGSSVSLLNAAAADLAKLVDKFARVLPADERDAYNDRILQLRAAARKEAGG